MTLNLQLIVDLTENDMVIDLLLYIVDDFEIDAENNYQVVNLMNFFEWKCVVKKIGKDHKILTLNI